MDIVPRYKTWLKTRSELNLNHTTPFLVNDDGSAFAYTHFKVLLARACKHANLPSKRILAHSFRKGAAVTLHNGGGTVADLKLLGNWRSDAYLIYITPTDLKQEKLQRLIANSAL